jgi:hypothetical protein
LDPDHVKLNARFETAFDQNIICRRNIKIIDEKCGGRVGFACRLEQGLDHLDASHFPAKTRDAVVIFIENWHDHSLVDHVPHVDQAAEIRNIALDAGDLRL